MFTEFQTFFLQLDSSIIKERSIICVSMLHRVYKCVFLMHLDEKYVRICTNINLQSLMLCEICGFVTYLSFECEVPELLELYSQTKMLNLRKSQTLHQKNTHFWIFLQQWALMIGHFFVMKSKISPKFQYYEFTDLWMMMMNICYTQFPTLFLTFPMQVTHCFKATK